MDERTRELLEQAVKDLAECSILFKLLSVEKMDEEAGGAYLAQANHLEHLINDISTHLKENTNV